MHPLKWYGTEIQERAADPHGLAGLLILMSVDFAQANNSKIAHAVDRANYFVRHKDLTAEKPLSDKAVDAMYLLTPEGLEHKKNEIYLKALISLMSNLKAALRNAENESRNSY